MYYNKPLKCEVYVIIDVMAGQNSSSIKLEKEKYTDDYSQYKFVLSNYLVLW